MRVPLLEAVKTQAPLVSDGGIGTSLQKAGLEPGGCGDNWNLTHAEKVEAVHRGFIEAGSQIVTTNTFGSNRFVLANYGLESRVRELCRAGAQIARQAAGEERWVLGSVGPCGGFLEPLGEVSRAALEDSLREQMAALLESSVDAIILETMTALEEMEIGLRVARELHAPCVIASFAFDRTRIGYKTMMGVTPEKAAQLAVDEGADILGANCGTGLYPGDFAEIAQAFRNVTDLPLCLQPNAGQPRLVGTMIVYDISPQEMGGALFLLAQNAQIAGGCCGTTPEHIRAFRTLLDNSPK